MRDLGRIHRDSIVAGDQGQTHQTRVRLAAWRLSALGATALASSALWISQGNPHSFLSQSNICNLDLKGAAPSTLDGWPRILRTTAVCLFCHEVPAENVFPFNSVNLAVWRDHTAGHDRACSQP